MDKQTRAKPVGPKKRDIQKVLADLEAERDRLYAVGMPLKDAEGRERLKFAHIAGKHGMYMRATKQVGESLYYRNTRERAVVLEKFYERMRKEAAESVPNMAQCEKAITWRTGINAIEYRELCKGEIKGAQEIVAMLEGTGVK